MPFNPESEIHKAAATEFSADKPIKTREMWKGNHRAACEGHRDKLCRAIHAWMLNAHHEIVPVLINMSTEKRARVQVEYDETGEDKDPEMLHASKGWLEAKEARRGVRPHPKIVEILRERGRLEVVNGMRELKASFADTNAAEKDFCREFDEKNLPSLPPPKRAANAG